MDEPNNYEFYVKRAACARKLAGRARSPAIAAIHKQMADHYDTAAAKAAQQMSQRGEASQVVL